MTPNSNGGDGGATSSRADVQQVSKTGKSNLNSRRIHGMVSSPSVLLERNLDERPGALPRAFPAREQCREGWREEVEDELNL